MFNMRIPKTGNARDIKIYKNIAVSFLLKMIAAIISLVMVPLTLTCLGEYRNGVWLTISSMLLWIDQMDIGLGNGLRNKIAAYTAHGQTSEAKKAISSTLAMMICIIIPIAMILSFLIYHTDVFEFFNVEPSTIPDFRSVLFASVILVCMTFVFKIVGNVYMGLQLPAVNNLIIVCGQAIALVSTWLLLENECATFINIAVVNTFAPLLVFAFAYLITFYQRYPKLRPSFTAVDLRIALSLGNLGVRFFWLQIAGVIQFMTANILISKFFTPAMVTPYQVAYRYYSLVLVAFTVVCMPFWSATTDAYEKGDKRWIRMANRRMNLLTALTACAMILMTIVSPYVFQIWIGDKCHVPFSMTVLMAIYVFLLVMSIRYSYFLNGIGALRLQLYMTVMTIVFIPLAWFVSHTTHDILYFMGVMCVCIAPSILVNKIQFSKILKGTAIGIWRI